MISMRYCRVFVILCAIQAGGCAMLDTQIPSKVSTVGLIATPPQNYSTAKARYLGTRYKENLDRLVERIVRNPKTSNLQFANNISSVGGIGFFTHSATQSPDERYLEVVMGTPETFEKQISRSEKVARIVSLYGGELLTILSGDSDIFQDKELAGYGLNLAWRNVVPEPRGNRIVMERAIVYFSKERVREYVRRKLSQDALLSEAVIFAVEEDGPLQLVSYRPEELRADFRPAIREDNLPPTKLPAKPDPTPEAPPPADKVAEPKKAEPVASKAVEKLLPEPAVKSSAAPTAQEAPQVVKETSAPPAAKVSPAKEIQPAMKPKPALLPRPETLAMDRPLRPETPKAPSLPETVEQARAIPPPPLAQPKEESLEPPVAQKTSSPVVLAPPPEPTPAKEQITPAVEPAMAPPVELPRFEPKADQLEVKPVEHKPPLKASESALEIASVKKAPEPPPPLPLKRVEQVAPLSAPPMAPPAPARRPETAAVEKSPASPPPVKPSAASEPAEPIAAPKTESTPPGKIALQPQPLAPVKKEVAQPPAPAPESASPEVLTQRAPPRPPAPPQVALGEVKKTDQVALLPIKPAAPPPEVKPVIRTEPRALEGFVIQIAFQDREKARRWAEGMEKRGYAVSVTEAGAEGALRVRLGNFSQRDEAERQLRSFKEEGLSGIVISMPQRFRPEARSSVP